MTGLSGADAARLKALAEKASQRGEWRLESSSGKSGWPFRIMAADDQPIAVGLDRSDAEYLVAFGPDTALSLLAALADARAEGVLHGLRVAAYELELGEDDVAGLHMAALHGGETDHPSDWAAAYDFARSDHTAAIREARP